MIKHNYWLHCKEMIHTIHGTPMPSASVSIIIITLPVLKFMLAGFSILDPESSLEDGGKVALSLCEDATYPCN